jgi:hypothetical protein
VFNLCVISLAQPDQTPIKVTTLKLWYCRGTYSIVGVKTGLRFCEALSCGKEEAHTTIKIYKNQ